MGVSINGGTPLAGFIVENPNRKVDDDWGYPYDFGNLYISLPTPSTHQFLSIIFTALVVEKIATGHHGGCMFLPSNIVVSTFQILRTFCVSQLG